MPDNRKYSDRAEYLKNVVSKRRKKLRLWAIIKRGGKCEICGYAKCKQALEFHHLTGKKDFGISAKGYTRSWEKVQQEISKCVLVCANCHREIHAGQTQLSRLSGIEKRGEMSDDKSELL